MLLSSYGGSLSPPPFSGMYMYIYIYVYDIVLKTYQDLLEEHISTVPHTQLNCAMWTMRLNLWRERRANSARRRRSEPPVLESSWRLGGGPWPV